jgi:hypothetical protein
MRYFATIFLQKRPHEDFSAAGLLVAVVVLLGALFTNQVPVANFKLALVKDALATVTLLYLTNWLQAHVGQYVRWYNAVAFSLLGIGIASHLSGLLGS